ncbi:MAG: SDR family NAD(P)-dependent oxidoreductase [Bacteroidaceae bacterium]|nr:SDR family NAD(P)-dependent oxidoreductase [Bacteroidaceae bacterium]
MKRAIIIGASSGMGKEVSQLLLADGWQIGIGARRMDALQELQTLSPQQVVTAAIDVMSDDAPQRLEQLIASNGGMDLFFLASGIGKQNPNLESEIELRTVATNGMGFTRMVDTAFNWFATHGGKGQIAVISSIAGVKGLGMAPSYSATKAFQNTYIEALQQLAHMRHLDISFTDIRPGFVKTDLLNDGKNYPLLMNKDFVSRQIVKAIYRKKSVQIIDWRYRILVFFWHLIPRWLWVRLPIKN